MLCQYARGRVLCSSRVRRYYSTVTWKYCEGVCSRSIRSFTTLSHVDDQSHRPTMVDVSTKMSTVREAEAQTSIILPSAVLDTVLKSQILSPASKEPDNTTSTEVLSPKGAVFSTAIVAGTMAVKQTSSLIPFCHPLPINSCKFDIRFSESEFSQQPQKIIIRCKVKTEGQTGVEMEALTGVSVAALTVYDMLKALSHNIVIQDTRLVSKTGGKFDYQSGVEA